MKGEATGMAEHRVERRLAAILAGDVAGYSRLMGADEEGTLARLNAHRRELLEPTIAEHRGRIVKRTGDGILVEFGSAVDATRCAIEQQRGMAQRNAHEPADRRIELRIGIHVGDVIIDEGDIFGDGVNIAARLEGIAEAGGICISDDAFRQVRRSTPPLRMPATSTSRTSSSRCGSIAFNSIRPRPRRRKFRHLPKALPSQCCRFKT